MSNKLDIVDAQIHLFVAMEPEAAVSCMNSIGIQAAVIDEFWGQNTPAHEPLPGVRLPNGAFRPTCEGAAHAAAKHSDRFAFIRRIERRDPEVVAVVDEVKRSPRGRGVRLIVVSEDDKSALASGELLHVFRAADKAGLPLFAFSFGRGADLAQYAAACPGLKIVVDHCGMPQTVEAFQQVLGLAKFSNVHLKWSHAPQVFESTEYLFEGVWPYLGRAIDAFGVERLMRGSDFTAIAHGYTWAEALFYLRDSPRLSMSDNT